MTRYVYRTVDLKTNVVLEDIDLQNVQFSLKLSDVGDLTGDLPVPESRRGLLLDDATVPGRTGLYVLRDSQPVWGGIIWKRSWSEADAKFRLSCGSWESYAYHVIQSRTLSYANSDQLQIARDLLNLNGITAESGITWPTTGTSGRLRQRNMYPYDFKTVGLELEQLAGLENGFDYTVESYVGGDGSFGRRYLFGFPTLGRSASLDPAADSLTFDYPGNLAPFDLDEDAEGAAWKIFAIGAGEGTAMLSASATTTSFAAAGWPRLEAVVQYKDVSIQSTLQSHANEDLKAVTPTIDAWKFKLAPDSDVKLTDISLGDSAVFRLKSRRWETPIQAVFRITQISVTPGDHGSLEIVELGLSDERTTS
jgi:hypothetical protein